MHSLLSALKQQGMAFGSMLLGSSLVFSTVLYMNQQEKPPKEEKSQATVEFQVEKKPPPKKRKPKPRQQRPRTRRTNPQAPKAPDLSVGVSSVALEFSGVESVGFGSVSTELLGNIDKKGPMTAGALDNPPKPRSRGGTQEYPPRARKDGVEGYVLLNIYVREDGSVGTVKVLDANPPGVFDESAKGYVKGWFFDAGTYEGQTVDAWVKQKVVYKLQRS